MKLVDLRLTLSAFLNTVLLNQVSPNLIRIYGQSARFHRCVRKRQ